MIRGTTAQFRFKLPYTLNEINWATITFWQPGNFGVSSAPLPIIKQKNDCFAAEDPKVICVSLTAHETLRFSDEMKARVQLRAQSYNGTIFASKERLFTVYPISDDITPDIPDIPDIPGEGDGLIILDGMSIIQW